jgi:C4-dicarboxylate-specific signal transduction histidine kinase
MVFVPLGMHAEIGVLAAGSRRADFPGQTERLLLSVAANQAALGLQEARLFKEQQRLAGELDRTVAQRTAELAAANTELQREIAEHRLSDEALSRLRSELAHVSRVSMLGALTASIAHEVQQPLSGIVTNSSTCLRLLAADPPDIAGARETARRAIRDGNRAADVITRLRALFAKRDLTTEPVDLNEVTREVIALAVRELQHNGVALRSDLAGALPPVAGDRVQLQQVVLNLLLNASEAMSGIADRQRDVMVSTELESGDRVRLNVRDTGVGIDPQIKDKLFDAFYTTKADGMGIGLAVSRSIIENHRGRLWAASNDGPGATFSFTIPCTPDV